MHVGGGGDTNISVLGNVQHLELEDAEVHIDGDIEEISTDSYGKIYQRGKLIFDK